MTYFSGSKIFGCFEKHPKVVSGALRGGFRAREVFGSFEKRTPGLKLGVRFSKDSLNSEESKADQNNHGREPYSRSMRISVGMSWNQVKRTALNWVRWKAAVEVLCSGRSEED